MSRVITALHAVPVLLIGGVLAVAFMLPVDRLSLLAPMIAGVAAVTAISILLLLPRLTRWRLDELHGRGGAPPPPGRFDSGGRGRDFTRWFGPENYAGPRGVGGGSDDGDGDSGWSHGYHGHHHGGQYGHDHHVHGGHHGHCHSGPDSWSGSDSYSSSGSSSSSSYDSSSSSSSSDSSSSTSSC